MDNTPAPRIRTPYISDRALVAWAQDPCPFHAARAESLWAQIHAINTEEKAAGRRALRGRNKDARTSKERDDQWDRLNDELDQVLGKLRTEYWEGLAHDRARAENRSIRPAGAPTPGIGVVLGARTAA